MRQPCIVGVSDAKIDERGCVSKNSSVLSIQKDCAIVALNDAGLNITDILYTYIIGKTSKVKNLSLTSKDFKLIADNLFII